MTLFLVAIACLVIGFAIGMAFALVRLDRLVARMTDSELQQFGGRVVELRKRRTS